MTSQNSTPDWQDEPTMITKGSTGYVEISDGQFANEVASLCSSFADIQKLLAGEKNLESARIISTFIELRQSVMEHIADRCLVYRRTDAISLLSNPGFSSSREPIFAEVFPNASDEQRNTLHRIFSLDISQFN